MRRTRRTLTSLLLLALAGTSLKANPQTQTPPNAVQDPATKAAASEVRTDRYGDPLPAGAVARLGTIRFRRDTHELAGVAFLSDSKTVLAAGAQQIQFWDSATGRLLRELRTEPLWLVGFAISHDRKQVAVSGQHPWVGRNPGPIEIRVYDVSSGKVVRTFPQATLQEIYAAKLTFSADGKLVFSLGRTGILRAEEVDSGKERLQRKFPADFVQGLVSSPDGKYLAVASGANSRKLFLWKWQEEEPRELKAPQYGAHDISFSPDGKLLVGIGDLPGRLHVWEVPSGRLLYQGEPTDRAYYYTGPIFTPDGKSLVISLYGRSGTGSKIELLEPATGRSQGFLPTSAVRLTVSPDSQRLAGVDGRGMRIWNLTTRKELAVNNEAHYWPPTRILVSRGGLVVTAADDNSLRLWDAATSKQRHAHRLDGRLGDLSLSPDGTLLATSSFDDTVRLFAVDSGRETYRLPGHGRYGPRRRLAFLTDGKSFLSWGDDFYLRRWDVKTGRALLEHAIRPSGFAVPDYEAMHKLGPLGPGAGGTIVSNAVISPNGQMLMMQVGDHFHSFDVDTGKQKKKIASPLEGAFSLTISPNGKYVRSARSTSTGDTHEVILWGPDCGELLRLVVPGSSDCPIAFSEDGRSFATALESPAEIRVFETSSAQERRRIKGFRGTVRSLAFFPDGRRLASGMSDSTVLIWDLTAPPTE